MNIAKRLAQSGVLNNQQIVHKSFNFIPLQTVIKARDPSVPTHRGEFLPFTFNNLWGNPGYRRQKRRVGRGVGSTKGKTAGRGDKGQKSRSGGNIHPRFEGGQSSIVRRLPKMGVSVRNKERPKYVNIGDIMYYIDMGRLDPSKPVTMKALYTAGVFNSAKYGVKILGKGLNKLNVPLDLHVTDASESVITKVKELGGKVTCYHKTKLLMKEELNPEKFPFKLRDPLPTKRQVEKLEKIRDRGAEVVYKVPEWMQEELDKLAKEQKEDNKIKESEFTIPVPRVPNSGKDRIRKRKPQIWRTIDYNL